IILLMLFAFFLFRIDLFYNMLLNLIGIMMAFIVGLMMALLINLPMRFLEQHLGFLWRSPLMRRMKRGICLTASVLLVMSMITLFLVVIIPEIAVVAETLIGRVPAAIDQLEKWLLEYDTSLLQLAGIGEPSESNIRDFAQRAGNFLLGGITQSSTVVFSAAQMVINLVVGLVFSIYLLYSKERIRGQVEALISAYLPEKHSKGTSRVISLLVGTYSRFLGGQMIQAFVSAGLVWLFMEILGFPYALFVALITFLCAFIPIFGPYIAGALSALMIVTAAPSQTLWFLLMYFLVQQFESSLIYPRILSNAIDMPSIWVLVAVTLGGGIMGVAGMLFLIPLFAVIYRLLAEDTRRRNGIAEGDMPRG
ncbi:MAG: AI-2E family transporter, partial [Eubacteriales bacterium]